MAASPEYSPGPVFLSASLPSPERHPAYAASANPVAIREAVRALAEVVVPAARLVFGGHPEISPRVQQEAERLGAADNVVIYQSRFFEKLIPPASQRFRQLVWTPAGADRESSLRLMREQMLQSERFHAGVFIGGMEGVDGAPPGGGVHGRGGPHPLRHRAGGLEGRRPARRPGLCPALPAVADRRRGPGRDPRESLAGSLIRRSRRSRGNTPPPRPPTCLHASGT